MFKFKKLKKTLVEKKTPETYEEYMERIFMEQPQFDYSELQDGAKEYIKKEYSELCKQVGLENLYSFGVSPDEELTYLPICYTTHDFVKERKALYDSKGVKEKDWKYYTVEWLLKDSKDQKVQGLLERYYNESNDDFFNEYRNQRFDAVVNAFRKLAEEGTFDSNLILAVGVLGATEYTNQVAHNVFLEINKPKVVQMYLGE